MSYAIGGVNRASVPVAGMLCPRTWTRMLAGASPLAQVSDAQWVAAPPEFAVWPTWRVRSKPRESSLRA